MTSAEEQLTERRRARVRGVLAGRLGSVVVVAEAVRRRHNTSAILRSAEGFGLHEAHLVTRGFRPSKGTARGAERWLELHRHETTTACVEGLRARGFKLYIADLDPTAWTPDTVPVDGPVALLFGAELTGVSDEARSLADGVITVPMVGLTESLNVSAAAACAIYRVSVRRRDVLQSTTGSRADLSTERQQAFYDAWTEREVAAKRGRRARTTTQTP